MKKALCLLLSCLMLLALLAACGGSDNAATPTPAGGSSSSSSGSSDSGNTEQPDPSAIDWDKHQVFDIWMYSTSHDLYAGYSNNPCINYLNQMFNVTLQFEQPVSGTEADSLSLMFGTGQYTDLIDISSYQGSIGDLYADGVIINFADYLQYMPNLVAQMEADPNVRKQFFNDEGQMLILTNFSETEQICWGGLVYRHDILETMTGGNVAFPSGNDTPTTVADWEYMLMLFKMYFEAAGMAEYAPLILPYNGSFYFGEFNSGFGFPTPGYFYDTRTNAVNHGYLTDGFYNYVKKMNEWFEAGYIYQDFASRTNDMFFLPNTSLTYGAAAGIWYGLQAQLGDLMSMPEYGLFFDVRPLATPIDVDYGITSSEVIDMLNPKYEDAISFVVTTACKDIPKLLSVLDFMYSDEGGWLWAWGMTKEQIPANDVIYTSNGLEDGAYWFDDAGNIVINPLIDLGGGPIQRSDINCIRVPGYIRNGLELPLSSPLVLDAHNTWKNPDGKLKRLPSKISHPLEEEILLNNRNVAINDYAGSMIPQFIMGTTAFDEAAFEAFKAQLISLGLEDNIKLQQEALNRYQNR